MQLDLYQDNTTHWIRSHVTDVSTLSVCGALGLYGSPQPPHFRWFFESVTCDVCRSERLHLSDIRFELALIDQARKTFFEGAW